MSEHIEQCKVFAWRNLNLKYNKNQEVLVAMKRLHSVPNGGKYEHKENKYGKWSPIGQKMVREGLTKGVLDVHLKYPVSPFHGLEIEMKVLKWKYSQKRLNLIKKQQYFEDMEDEQMEQRELALQLNYQVFICYTGEEAIRRIVEYLPFPKSMYQGLREYRI